MDQTSQVSVYADFMEGIIGVILTWPVLVTANTSIEVQMPQRQGKLLGQPIAEEDLHNIDVAVIAPYMVTAVSHYLNRLIGGEEKAFATLHHLKGGQFRATLWKRGCYEALKTV